MASENTQQTEVFDSTQAALGEGVAGDSGKKRSGRSVLMKILCALVFLLFALAAFYGVNVAVGMEGTVQNIGAFRALDDSEENSIDVGYIGSSATSRYFVNPLAYEEEGISSFTLGVQSTPVVLYKHLIGEIEMRQDPEVYVIELRPITRDDGSVPEVNYRRPIDSMNLLSINRIAAINTALETMGEQLDSSKYDDNFLDYLLPVVKYHDALASDDTDYSYLIDKPYNVMQGFAYSSETYTQVPQKKSAFSDEVGSLTDLQKEHLKGLFEYCETLDAEVLFVLSPRVLASKRQAALFNAVEAYAKDSNQVCLNFNSEELFNELGLDVKTDFYNSRHTNYLGAEKYTSWLSNYLKRKYDLEDHRGDEKYQAWEEGYEEYKKFTADGIQIVSATEIKNEE